MAKFDLSDHEAAESGSNAGYEVPRMVKKKNGQSLNNISAAAIMGEEHQHLPVYVDKIRPQSKAIAE